MTIFQDVSYLIILAFSIWAIFDWQYTNNSVGNQELEKKLFSSQLSEKIKEDVLKQKENDAKEIDLEIEIQVVKNQLSKTLIENEVKEKEAKAIKNQLELEVQLARDQLNEETTRKRIIEQELEDAKIKIEQHYYIVIIGTVTCCAILFLYFIRWMYFKRKSKIHLDQSRQHDLALENNTEESISASNYRRLLFERENSDKEDSNCDFTIIAKGVRFPIHKSVVELSSEFLKEIFSRNSERREAELEVCSKDLKVLLDFMYDIPIDLKKMALGDVVTAYKLSNLLLFEKFINKCVNFGRRWSEEEDVGGMYELLYAMELEEEMNEIELQVLQLFDPDASKNHIALPNIEKISSRLLLAALRKEGAEFEMKYDHFNWRLEVLFKWLHINGYGSFGNSTSLLSATDTNSPIKEVEGVILIWLGKIQSSYSRSLIESNGPNNAKHQESWWKINLRRFLTWNREAIGDLTKKSYPSLTMGDGIITEIPEDANGKKAFALPGEVKLDQTRDFSKNDNSTAFSDVNDKLNHQEIERNGNRTNKLKELADLLKVSSTEDDMSEELAQTIPAVYGGLNSTDELEKTKPDGQVGSDQTGVQDSCKETSLNQSEEVDGTISNQTEPILSDEKCLVKEAQTIPFIPTDDTVMEFDKAEKVTQVGEKKENHLLDNQENSDQNLTQESLIEKDMPKKIDKNISEMMDGENLSQNKAGRSIYEKKDRKTWIGETTRKYKATSLAKPH